MKVPIGVRALVLSRDGGRCVRCGTSCLNTASSIHHRRRRGMGGTADLRSFDARNLVLLCGTGTTGCHGEVEAERAIAYDTGWLLRSYDDLDAPLISKDGRRIYLTTDGGRTEVIDAESILAAGVFA